MSEKQEKLNKPAHDVMLPVEEYASGQSAVFGCCLSLNFYPSAGQHY